MCCLIFDVLPLAGWIKKEGAGGPSALALGTAFPAIPAVSAGARKSRLGLVPGGYGRHGFAVPPLPPRVGRLRGCRMCFYLSGFNAEPSCLRGASASPVFRQPSAVPGRGPKRQKPNCRFEMSAKKDAKKFFRCSTFIRKSDYNIIRFR